MNHAALPDVLPPIAAPAEDAEGPAPAAAKLSAAETIAVIDFETTGMGPGQGARATEIAAVLVREGRIVGQYASLMRTGAWIPPFIEQLTGISNAMLADAPPAAEVMAEVLAFTRGCPLVAHNASFDRGFWHAEAALAGLAPDPVHDTLACTVLLSRRVYPDAPNHKLGGLASYHDLPREGRAHRALSDALLTAHLLLRIQADLAARHDGATPAPAIHHAALRRIQVLPRRRFEREMAEPGGLQRLCA